MTTLGQIAYREYGDFTGWKTFSGSDMLPWTSLGQNIQGAWEAAARAAVREFTKEEVRDE